MPKDAPLAVEVPALDRDKPGWVKVGVIAAVGFIIGIAWPRVVGVRLGPAAPGEAAAAASASAHGGRAPEAPPASVVAKSPAVASAAPSSAPPSSVAAIANANGTSGPPVITIGKGAVLSCKTAEGEAKKGQKECGSVPGIDQLVQPRVRKIATCAGAEGQTGKLSLVVNADFSSGRFWYDVGKSSTVQNLDAVSACVKTAFHGTSTTATPHEHPRYTVAYTATLAPPPGGGADEKSIAQKADKADRDRPEKSAKEAPEPKDEKPSASDAPPPSSGEALVGWEVALVRDAPKTGGLVSRLPRGTKVKVGTTKDGWYLIKFGDGFASEGWVYRGAIGR